MHYTAKYELVLTGLNRRIKWDKVSTPSFIVAQWVKSDGQGVCALVCMQREMALGCHSAIGIVSVLHDKGIMHCYTTALW